MILMLAILCSVRVDVGGADDDWRHQFAEFQTSDVLTAYRHHADQLVGITESRHERLDEPPQSTLEVHSLPAAAVLRHPHLRHRQWRSQRLTSGRARRANVSSLYLPSFFSLPSLSPFPSMSFPFPFLSLFFSSPALPSLRSRTP